jgi:hypothetical protein
MNLKWEIENLRKVLKKNNIEIPMGIFKIDDKNDEEIDKDKEIYIKYKELETKYQCLEVEQKQNKRIIIFKFLICQGKDSNRGR